MATNVCLKAGRAVHPGTKLSALPSRTIATTHRRSGKSSLFGYASSAADYQMMRMARCQSATDVVAETVAEPAASTLAVTAMDIRIGQIKKVEKHPDADSLYVEEVDVGEAEPRTIVSGLVNFVSLEQMQDRKVVVLCNLKPRNMRGIKSHGMLLCASNDTHDQVEPLSVPAEAAIGERVWFGDNKLQPAPAEPNRVQKKKIWEEVQPDLKTDGSKMAGYKGAVMNTSAGPITAASLAAASIS